MNRLKKLLPKPRKKEAPDPRASPSALEPIPPEWVASVPPIKPYNPTEGMCHDFISNPIPLLIEPHAYIVTNIIPQNDYTYSVKVTNDPAEIPSHVHEHIQMSRSEFDEFVGEGMNVFLEHESVERIARVRKQGGKMIKIRLEEGEASNGMRRVVFAGEGPDRYPQQNLEDAVEVQ